MPALQIFTVLTASGTAALCLLFQLYQKIDPAEWLLSDDQRRCLVDVGASLSEFKGDDPLIEHIITG